MCAFTTYGPNRRGQYIFENYDADFFYFNFAEGDLGEKVHAVCVYADGRMKLYFNGTLWMDEPGATNLADTAFLVGPGFEGLVDEVARSEEHTSELQSLMRISYAVFCLKKKKICTKVIKSKIQYQ